MKDIDETRNFGFRGPSYGNQDKNSTQVRTRAHAHARAHTHTHIYIYTHTYCILSKLCSMTIIIMHL